MLSWLGEGQFYEGESNENLKSAIRIIYKHLRFSFDSSSYLLSVHVTYTVHPIRTGEKILIIILVAALCISLNHLTL